MNPPRLEHPDRSTLTRFLHGQLSDAEQATIEKHVAACDFCCDILRGVPHDDWVRRIQHADTDAGHGETHRIAESQIEEIVRQGTSEAAELPAELVEHPRYRIVRQLGAGGMGVVFQAEHRLMERTVALKVINAQLVDSPMAVERFRLEVKAAAKLSHRNIVAAYDAEQAGALHFLVMEFIEGVSLAQLVRHRGPLSVLHACNYAMQVAQGLQHALDHSMVHRDIKPHNLMRTSKGIIKILDFGLARLARPTDEDSQAGGDDGLTGDGATLGTPDYIAPEQARDSRQADIRADIYSLGCTLYFMLTGKPPFPRGSAVEKVIAHVEQEATPLRQLRADVPESVAAIVHKMMAKQPDDRFQTPAEVVEALRPYGVPTTDSSTAISQGEHGSPIASPTSAASPTPPATTSPVAGEETLIRAREESPVSESSAATGANSAATAMPSVESLPSIHGTPLPEPMPVSGEQSLNSPRRRSPFALNWAAWRPADRRVAGPIAMAIIALLAVSILWPRWSDWLSHSGSRPVDGAWIDLIDRLDADEDAVSGSWRVEGQQLMTAASVASVLLIPYDVPREYDFEVEFTRQTGTDSIALHFVSGRGQATFDVDGWGEHLAGIQNIDQQTMRENSTRNDNIRLENGRRYVAQVRVRRDRVEGYLDGQLLATYRGNGDDLSMLELWNIAGRRQLGVGAYDSTAIFHRIRVRPVQ